MKGCNIFIYMLKRKINDKSYAVYISGITRFETNKIMFVKLQLLQNIKLSGVIQNN